MSLTERLKAAQAVRQAEAAPSLGPPAEPAEAVLDLRTASELAVDLTGSEPTRAIADPAGPAGPTGGISGGTSYDPVRSGDASLASGDGNPLVADRVSYQNCPRCGGPTQVDLFDQVHQMVSLSCNTCFHMFRAPA